MGILQIQGSWPLLISMQLAGASLRIQFGQRTFSKRRARPPVVFVSKLCASTLFRGILKSVTVTIGYANFVNGILLEGHLVIGHHH